MADVDWGSHVSIGDGAQLELAGLQAIEDKLVALLELDFAPLMTIWEDLLQDDERDAALKGLDGDGDPLTPVKYRPVDVPLVDYKLLPNDNLTSSHYRSLDGPPLAPRGLDSRRVKNFRTASAQLSDGRWAVVGAWEGILDPQGRPFFSGHFVGAGNNPVRDLRGVRPRLVAQVRDATDSFLAEALATAESL